jgi:hypothetical protein
LHEGFGNAFLEAIYFKKPMLINRYATFVRDIEPLGFDLIAMDGYLTRKAVEDVIQIIQSPERKEEMVNRNYDVASHYFSYDILRSQLESIMVRLFGDSKSRFLDMARPLQPNRPGNGAKGFLQPDQH